MSLGTNNLRSFAATSLFSNEKIIIYTDGSESPQSRRVGLVIFKPNDPQPIWKGVDIESALLLRLGIVEKNNNIFSVEMLALALTSSLIRFLDFNTKNILWLCDNDGCTGSILKGNSKNDSVNPLIESFWMNLTEYRVWIERVDTTLNLADEPSRNRTLAPPFSGEELPDHLIKKAIDALIKDVDRFK